MQRRQQALTVPGCGAMQALTSNMYFYNCSFTSCRVVGEAGGAVIISVGTTVFYGCTFTNCSANQYGDEYELPASARHSVGHLVAPNLHERRQVALSARTTTMSSPLLTAHSSNATHTYKVYTVVKTFIRIVWSCRGAF